MEEVIAGGGKVDEIPPERTLVVTVLLGRELMVDGQMVSRAKAVTRQGEVSGDVLWWVGGSWTSVIEVLQPRDVVPGRRVHYSGGSLFRQLITPAIAGIMDCRNIDPLLPE